MTNSNNTPLNGSSFDFLVDEVGMDVAWALCKNFGGTDLIIPPTSKGQYAKRIIDAIGEDFATRIFHASPRFETIYVPKKPMSMHKNKEVVLFYVKKRLTEGATPTKIAKELDVTIRSVRSYRQQIERNQQNVGLIASKDSARSNSNAPLTHHASENRTLTPNTDKNAS